MAVRIPRVAIQPVYVAGDLCNPCHPDRVRSAAVGIQIAWRVARAGAILAVDVAIRHVGSGSRRAASSRRGLGPLRIVSAQRDPRLGGARIGILNVIVRQLRVERGKASRPLGIPATVARLQGGPTDAAIPDPVHALVDIRRSFDIVVAAFVEDDARIVAGHGSRREVLGLGRRGHGAADGKQRENREGEDAARARAAGTNVRCGVSWHRVSSLESCFKALESAASAAEHRRLAQPVDRAALQVARRRPIRRGNPTAVTADHRRHEWVADRNDAPGYREHRLDVGPDRFSGSILAQFDELSPPVADRRKGVRERQAGLDAVIRLVRPDRRMIAQLSIHAE